MVTFGYPLGYEEQEVVALGGLESADESEVVLGSGQHDEVYVILVEIKVYDPAGEADDVDERGFALADEVRSVVNANDTLDGLVRHAMVTAQLSQGAVPARFDADTTAPGWVIFLTLRVACSARVS